MRPKRKARRTTGPADPYIPKTLHNIRRRGRWDRAAVKGQRVLICSNYAGYERFRAPHLGTIVSRRRGSADVNVRIKYTKDCVGHWYYFELIPITEKQFRELEHHPKVKNWAFRNRTYIFIADQLGIQ